MNSLKPNIWGRKKWKINFLKWQGEKARCYDDYIDEGIDDEDVEDEYLYCSAFEFENTNLIVRIYYGNVTSEITHINCN